MKQISEKVIIWDLGNTLVDTNTFGIMQQIGLVDFVLYLLIDHKNPVKIKDILFEVLNFGEELPSNAIDQKATDKGKILPLPICNWLSGNIKSNEIYQNAYERIDHLDKAGYFISKRQRELIKKIFNFMFDPIKLASYMRPIKSGLKLLDECSKNSHNKLFILSNWDAESFRYLISCDQIKQLFAYFDPENIVISGNIGMIKPQPTIYNYIINKFNLDPHNTIFIDDQAENVNAAQKWGMTGLLLENNNYKKLKANLIKLNVL